MAENKVQITMAASDKEVQDRFDKLEMRISQLQAKLKDTARVSKEGSKESAQGMGEFDRAIDGVGKRLQAFVTAGIFAAIGLQVKKLVDQTIQEMDRLAKQSQSFDRAMLGALQDAGMLKAPGDFQRVRETLASTQSILKPEERVQILGRMAASAPGESLDTLLQGFQAAAGTPATLRAGDVEKTAKFGENLMRMVRQGFSVQEAVDLTNAVTATQGGQDALNAAVNLTELAVANDPTIDARQMVRDMVPITVGLAQAGFQPTRLAEGFGSFSGRYEREIMREAQQFATAEGFPVEQVAEQMRRERPSAARRFQEVLTSPDQQSLIAAGFEGGVAAYVATAIQNRDVAAAQIQEQLQVTDEQRLANLDPLMVSEFSTDTRAQSAELRDLQNQRVLRTREGARRYSETQARFKEELEPGIGRMTMQAQLWAGRQVEKALDVMIGEPFGVYDIPRSYTTERERARARDIRDGGGGMGGSPTQSISPQLQRSLDVAEGNRQQFGPPPVTVNISISQLPDGSVADYSAALDNGSPIR